MISSYFGAAVCSEGALTWPRCISLCYVSVGGSVSQPVLLQTVSLFVARRATCWIVGVSRTSARPPSFVCANVQAESFHGGRETFLQHTHRAEMCFWTLYELCCSWLRG